MAANAPAPELLPWAIREAKTRRLFLIGIFFCVFLPLVLFGGLAKMVLAGDGLPFDEPILRWLYDFSTPERDRWVVALSDFGAPWPVSIYVAVVIAVLLVFRKWRHAEFVALAVMGALLLNLVVKRIFIRPRPQLWETIVTETSFSFPSGHSIGSMSFAIAMGLLAWRTRRRWPVIIGALFFAFAVGLSRVYLGVHYPSDVAAAWCVAVAWVGGVYGVQRWRMNRARPPAIPGPG